ncbi:MAG: ribbon-helix-helix protein, CopG family [Candidatus Viridilinea halotolerans]|uniref:Ribbon-helix-helix protein, CopG family n=1 Tax=Candidatus Viridilinea halotolerans TaxID=2491704 RepID=A0A426TZV5_9CHLR|nr:MAG: ribbon-helix-helix protein, CopG family [Candidatus Viridilinea halotolerans]
MAATKVAITIDSSLLAELDRLVEQHVFPNRSRAIQEALSDKLARMRRRRLAQESAKLSIEQEQAFAEEGIQQDLEQWPEY